MKGSSPALNGLAVAGYRVTALNNSYIFQNSGAPVKDFTKGWKHIAHEFENLLVLRMKEGNIANLFVMIPLETHRAIC